MERVDRVDLTGAVLDGRYRVIEPVAEGGMGVVYRAERIHLGRIVAVKVLHEVLPNELSSRKRFEIEAKAMAKLEHPHCASVVDVGLHGDRPFVVMDFVSGQNLKDVIAAQAPLPVPRAVELLRQILSGLAHAHELGIIHRDIKPANLVLSQKAGLGDHVKILDFGLARLGQDSSLTTGVVVGTPSYMAPEQIRGVMIDSRVDLYACGVVLFEMLTGTKPFVSPKDDPIEICTMHLKVPAPRLADRRPDLELAALEPIVARALAKAAGDRFATAVELAEALDAVVPRRGVAPTPVAGVPALEPRTTTEYAGIAPGEQPRARVATPAAGAKTLPLPLGVASAAPALEGSDTVPSPPPSSPPPAPEGSDTVPSPPPALVPAKPAPAPAKPAPAPAKPPAKAPPTPRRRPGLAVILIALAAVGLAAVGLLLISRGGGGASATPDAAVAPAPEPGPPDPAAEALVRADQLLADGQRVAALDLALAARKTSPRDPRLAFLAGRLYFDKLFWTEGLRQLRDAIRLDPRYRTDPELIKIVLRGFITTPRADAALAGFLHDEIGDAAKPYLEETAATHHNPVVRSRAAAELKRYP